jgi:hypothetical protein
MPSFRVVKSDGFKFAGQQYDRGAVIEIPEGHPRLEMLKNAGYISYNAGDTTPTPREPSQPKPKQQRRRKKSVKTKE